MRDPIRSYRESAVRGASPLGLIVILYEEIVRSIQKALQAFARGDIEARGKALTHAVEVIGYLQSILDFEKGGDVARNLSNFYNLMRGQLLSIHVTPTREGLEMLAREFAKVGAAWQQAERAMAQPAQPANTMPKESLLAGAAARVSVAVEESLVAIDR